LEAVLDHNLQVLLAIGTSSALSLVAMGLGQVSLEARVFLAPAPIIDLLAMTAKLLIARFVRRKDTYF
jgi:hypothetical protein